MSIAEAGATVTSTVLELDHGKFVYKDEQTKWVDRLLDVATTINDELGEKQLLIVQSCLRPIEKEVNRNSKKVDTEKRTEFMNKSIKFCNNKYNDEGDFETLSNREKVLLRLISNVLLKEHWEYLSENDKYQERLADIYQKSIIKIDKFLI